MAHIFDIRDMYAISPAEAVDRAAEDTKKQAQQYRIPDQEMLENRDMARGWPMGWTELVRRISLLNSAIIIEPGGMPNALAVRIVDNSEKDEKGQPLRRYITGFYMESLPEWSSVLIDDQGLPTREIRGWRTVLACLIRAKALTLKQVELTFGKACGQRAAIWDRTVARKP